MKKVILSFGLILMSSMAFAQQRIDLSAGSTVTIQVDQTTTVSCGSSSGVVGGQCKLQQDNFGAYMILGKDGHVMASNLSLDGGLETAKKMKDAGLCN